MVSSAANESNLRSMEVWWCEEENRNIFSLNSEKLQSLQSSNSDTRNHILLSQIWDFLFVASYDSQGHGGGIRPRLHTGYSPNRLSLSLILRPTVSRPLYLGIKHPSGAYDQIFICLWQLRPCFCGRPLWREDGSDFCIRCWHSPA
jgi:hypothetical protein